MRKSSADRLAKGLWWDGAVSANVGCTPVSEGCERCWSAAWALRMSEHPNRVVQERYTGLTAGVTTPKFTGTVRFLPERLLVPFSKIRHQVFAVWNDVFHESMTDAQIALTLAMVMGCRRHDFVICTKRPERALQFFRTIDPDFCRRRALDFWGPKFLRYWNAAQGWPDAWDAVDNLVLMVSCENQARADERLPELVQMPLQRRALALAPLLGPVDWSPWADELQWCVAECESGRGRRPGLRNWFRQARDICAAHEVAFFLKQMEFCCKVERMPPLDNEHWDQFPE